MVLVVGIFVLAPGKGSAIEPDSSEVKQMVERALKWMENQDDERLGGRCLIGLSYYKAGRPLTHPKVVAAKNACESSIAIDVKQLDNYSVGLALVFLLETDPDRNRSLARRYVDELLRRQQRAGGWGYPETPTGDTSQTQYPTLGLWLAINNGIDVPVNVIERICNWLLRTQDPSGAWGYQGVDPGHYRRVNQAEVRPALAAAGLGSLFICADILAANEIKAPAERTGTGMPSALKPVGDPLETKSRPSGITVDSKLIRQALNDGNYWFARHYTLESEGHTHYYHYAFERYQGFRELAERRVDSSPQWYRDIVAKLKASQQPDGSWNAADGAPVTTSFAVLTLLRSTKKSIASITVAPKLGDGVLLGGKGLPKNTADLQEKDGRVVESLLAG
ncbi:MAG TPA: prenyltransferase/squalene oxidase repeat-containing protein, partial [Pirellulaceae bacterium]|nr:prenyltransferase/squalene oxidase repeat-containing protein [Pirellulaceae bacterium]